VTERLRDELKVDEMIFKSTARMLLFSRQRHPLIQLPEPLKLIILNYLRSPKLPDPQRMIDEVLNEGEGARLHMY
jgi:hypothetical protein